jgi:hypothetical protein
MKDERESKWSLFNATVGIIALVVVIGSLAALGWVARAPEQETVESFMIDTVLLGEWHGISPLTYTRLDFLASGGVVVTRADGSSDNAKWYVTNAEKGHARLCLEMRSGTKDCADYQLENGGYYGYVSFDGGIYSRP